MTELNADAMLDAIALVRAAMQGDRKAGEVILDHCDQRAVAAQLALLAATGLQKGLGGSELAIGFLDWVTTNAAAAGIGTTVAKPAEGEEPR